MVNIFIVVDGSFIEKYSFSATLKNIVDFSVLKHENEKIREIIPFSRR
jgi:hypothetical protein